LLDHFGAAFPRRSRSTRSAVPELDIEAESAISAVGCASVLPLDSCRGTSLILASHQAEQQKREGSASIGASGWAALQTTERLNLSPDRASLAPGGRAHAARAFTAIAGCTHQFTHQWLPGGRPNGATFA